MHTLINPATKGTADILYKTKPTNTPLNKILGIPTRYLFFILLATIPASKVAREPKAISIIPKGLAKFDKIHPTKSPGTAEGVKYTNTFNASDILTWFSPKASGEISIVHTV